MDNDAPDPASKSAWIAMGAIVIVLLLVAIYANWQNAHRQKIESVTITRFNPSPSPSPER
jgi:hypothetical protein